MFSCFQLLLITPESRDSFGMKDYEDNQCCSYVITNLKWFFNYLLGILLGPPDVRAPLHRCSDGVVLKQDLLRLIYNFDVDVDLLIHVLDHFKVSMKN